MSEACSLGLILLAKLWPGCNWKMAYAGCPWMHPAWSQSESVTASPPQSQSVTVAVPITYNASQPLPHKATLQDSRPPVEFKAAFLEKMLNHMLLPSMPHSQSGPFGDDAVCHADACCDAINNARQKAALLQSDFLMHDPCSHSARMCNRSINKTQWQACPSREPRRGSKTKS